MKHRIIGISAICLIALIPVREQNNNSIGFTSQTIQGYQSSHFNSQSPSLSLDMKSGGRTEHVTDVILDTGSFTTLVPIDVANSLNLPYEGRAIVCGVDGTPMWNCYHSYVTIQIGTQVFKDVSCIVTPSFNTTLLGADFFRDNNVHLSIDFRHNKISFSDAK